MANGPVQGGMAGRSPWSDNPPLVPMILQRASGGSRIACLVLSVTASACTAPVPDASEGRFVVNEHRRVITPRDNLPILRSAWKSTPQEILSLSKVAVIDRTWAFDFIARIESEGPRPCRSLDLVEVSKLEARPFATVTVDGQRVRFQPDSHLEQWTVRACGETRRWRLFNEMTDPSNPFRVLLWDVVFR